MEAPLTISLDECLSHCIYLNLFSAAFQLITSQIALKYSALRFWY